MTERQCGECTMCCTTHGVASLKKPAGVTCSHLSALHGCTVYPTRPRPCINYRCFWLEGNLQAKDKPSLTGVVIDQSHISLSTVATVTTVWHITARKSRAAQRRLKAFTAERPGDIFLIRVIAPNAGVKIMFPPHLSDTEIQEDVKRTYRITDWE